MARLIRTSGFAWVAAVVACTACFRPQPTTQLASASGNPAANWPAANQIREYTSRAGTFGFTGGVLIARAGAPVHVAGYGFANREKNIRFGSSTPFDVGSFTKQFTAGAVLKLVDQGRLSLNDSLYRVLPSAPPDKRHITIHQLLSNTSGLGEYSGDDFELIDRGQLIARAMNDTLAFAPGTRYQYSNTGFSLLAAIVELVSGSPYESYLRETLLLPGGMRRTGYVLPDWSRDSVARNYSRGENLGNQLDKPWLPDGPSWNLRGNGGMLSTLDDLLRWYHVLRDGRLLSPGVVSRLSTPYLSTDREGLRYGYAMFIRDTPNGREAAHGGGASYGTSMNFRWLPEIDALVAYVINQRDIDPAALGVQRNVSAIIGGHSVRMPPRANARLPAGELSAIAGTYELAGGSRFTIAARDTVLVIPTTSAGIGRVLLPYPDSALQKIDSTLERLTLDAVRSLAGGDLAPMIALMDTTGRDMEEERLFWSHWSDTTRARLGAFRDAEVVAILREPRGLVLNMWAVFDRGARPVAARVLENGKLSWGFRRPILEDEYRFLPLTRNRSVSHDLLYGMDTFLDVVRDDQGGVRGVEIRRGHGVWRAHRVR